MKTDWKFQEHDAVWYKGKIGRIESCIGIDAFMNNLYLVQFTNHLYICIPEKDLERYIG